MKRFPELKPNFWDVIVVLAVIALAALSAMTVWRGGTETGTLTAVVTADGQEIDRFAPADLLDAPRTYSYNGVTLTSLIYNGTKLYCRKFRRTIKNLITANIAESRKKAEYV